MFVVLSVAVMKRLSVYIAYRGEDITLKDRPKARHGIGTVLLPFLIVCVTIIIMPVVVYGAQSSPHLCMDRILEMVRRPLYLVNFDGILMRKACGCLFNMRRHTTAPGSRRGTKIA